MMKKPRFSVHSLVPHYSRETRKLNGQARSNSTIYRNESDQRIAPAHSLHSPFPLLPLLSSLSLLLPPLSIPPSSTAYPIATLTYSTICSNEYPSKFGVSCIECMLFIPQALISSRINLQEREGREKREKREEERRERRDLPRVRIRKFTFCQTSRRITCFRERSKVGTSVTATRFDYSPSSARVRK